MFVQSRKIRLGGGSMCSIGSWDNIFYIKIISKLPSVQAAAEFKYSFGFFCNFLPEEQLSNCFEIKRHKCWKEASGQLTSSELSAGPSQAFSN